MSWITQNNSLQKIFTFPDFVTALAFVNQVGDIAERFGHHPEIWFTWGKVIITTTTHDQGNSVTEKDIVLAQEIDKLMSK